MAMALFRFYYYFIGIFNKISLPSCRPFLYVCGVAAAVATVGFFIWKCKSLIAKASFSFSISSALYSNSSILLSPVYHVSFSRASRPPRPSPEDAYTS